MTSANFWDISVWEALLTISVLFITILLSTILCRLIKPLRKLLLPMPVIAGFLLLFIILIYNLTASNPAENPLLNTQFLEALTYHGLGLGFVAIALKHPQKKTSKKKHNTDVMNAGLITVSGYLIQGIVGLAVTLLLSYVLVDVFAVSGLILPMGYGQGPGQAYIWGKNYADLGFTNGASFGLAVSSAGFVASAIGGAIYLSRTKNKKIDLSQATEEQSEGESKRKLSGNVDKLTTQIALVLLVYAFTYLVMEGLRLLFNASGVAFLMETVNSLIWGFNFMFGMIFGIVARKIVIKIENKKQVEILDDTLLSRISGTSFDIMIVSSMAAINLAAFLQPSFVLPLSIICVLGAVVTYFQVKFSCKKLYPGYVDESFLSLFGMLTGTASTGMILLRQVDSEYKTPAASNLVFQSVYAILFGFPVLLLMGFAPRDDLGKNGWAWLSLAIMVVMMVVYSLILFRRSIFKKKYASIEKGEQVAEQTDQNNG